MNKTTEEIMSNVAEAKERRLKREAAEKAKKVVPTAKAEWVIEALGEDIKKKNLVLPESIERNGKIYKVRKETIEGLIALSKMFFTFHTKTLEAAAKDYESKVGRPRPVPGETRKYQISNKGMLLVPIKFLLNKNLDGTGQALVTFYEDRIEVRNELLPAKK